MRCSSVKEQNKLLGNWYSNSDDNYGLLEFQFYKDSLVVYEILGKSSADWKIKNDKIHLTRINGFSDNNQLTYSYHLEESNQLLSLDLVGDSIIKLPKLRKAKNAFDFFKKTINLEIELPQSTGELKMISQQNRLNFNIYAGYKSDTLIVKTDQSSGLHDLEKEFKSYVNTLRDELKPWIKFNLVADKNITQTQMDSIKSRIRESFVTPIYRTYKNEEIDYKSTINWFGKIEDD
ncbi:hypothetical protein DSM03_101991 [Leeuwenhoekiella aestuarii]|uniref:Uncharacterized protein n=1 Tax=Leeuwenhoekiella aestuarii TaxID=2249426 RepID=A0A4Q0P284_9FLAO|nr:hypothetical protein DSM04_101502 [Leeuwenhoekiella aestuarii]RXG19614.1 hypothetical protein DSM03_101991 [Leeuwenhoekiella aestuarii]